MKYIEKHKAPELEGQTAKVWWFESTAEFAEHYEAAGITSGYWGNFTGNEDRAEALNYCRTGKDALVAEAEKLLGKIEAAGIERNRPEWHASPSGAYPIVPEFLAGRPNSMRRRIDVQTDRSPVRVFLDTTSSAGISAAQLARRGTACLAFVMALSAERPVELYAVFGGDGSADFGRNLSAICVRIPAAPLELATACYTLTSQGIIRGLGHGWTREKGGFEGGWPWGTSGPCARAEQLTRLAFDCEPQDLYIPGIHLEDELIKDPVGWINRTLAKYRAEDEQDA